MNCKNMQDLKNYQVEQLEKHIQDNQYFMGEKEDHAIDWKDAEIDFVNNYFSEVCKEMRIKFCTTLCPYGNDCELAKLFIKKYIDSQR